MITKEQATILKTLIIEEKKAQFQSDISNKHYSDWICASQKVEDYINELTSE